MNWYLKLENTGEITGPMSKDQVLVAADAFDGLVFCEEIFEPKFTIPEEVEGLLGEMRSLAGMRTTMPPGNLLLQAQELLKRATDTIILLSREKASPAVPLPKDVERAIDWLNSLNDSGVSVPTPFTGACSGEVAELLKRLVREEEESEVVSKQAIKEKASLPSEEVERLLIDLRDVKKIQEACFVNRGGSVICQQAIDMIARLSRKKSETSVTKAVEVERERCSDVLEVAAKLMGGEGEAAEALSLAASTIRKGES